MTLDLTALSDGELALLSIVGRDAAFAEIVRRHRQLLYRLVVSNIGDADEALDIVQETFVSAHTALKRYDLNRPMRSWLATIAINKTRDWARRRAVRRMISFAVPIDAAVENIRDERVGHDIELAQRQELQRLQRAIAQLPQSLSEPLVLHTIEDMSQAETAEVLGITQKAVETRLRRARIRLAQSMRR